MSFLSPYLSAVVPQMSSLSVIGRLLKPLGFEGLCAFMCLCGRGEQGVGCSVPPCFRLPSLSPISLSPPLPRPLAERSRSERRKESRSSLPLPGFIHLSDLTFLLIRGTFFLFTKPSEILNAGQTSLQACLKRAVKSV